MIIQCTECQSRFKLADDKLKPEGVKVRCTKCQHIFTVMPPQPPSEPVPPAAEDFSAEGQEDFSGFDAGQGGDFAFGAESAAADESPFGTDGEESGFSFDSAAGTDDFSIDTGQSDEFSFGDDEDAASDFSFDQEETGTETGDFSFEEEESAAGADDFSFDTDESEAAGDFSFDTDDSEAVGDFSLDSGNPFAEEGGAPSWESPEGSGPVDDFDFGAEADEAFDFESDLPGSFDEPPPSPPTAPAIEDTGAVQPTEAAGSKRKSRPVPPPTVARNKSPMSGLTAFLLVLLLILGGAAGYFVWTGKSLDIEQLLSRLTGRKTPATEAGRIKLAEVSGFFVTSKKEGQLFVIRGKAVNEYPEARSAIAVKGTLYSKSGKILTQQTAYCGNPLDDATLQKSPYSKIEESMNNQFGDSLSNLNVGPGKSIPFAIVFRKLPADLAEFATEVSTSQPGSRQ